MFSGGVQRYSFIVLQWYYYVNPYENYSFDDGMQNILRIVSVRTQTKLCLILLMGFGVIIFRNSCREVIKLILEKKFINSFLKHTHFV